MDELAEDILENFSLAQQILNDFCANHKDERRKLISSLLIDLTLREGEFAKFYQDVNVAKDNYEKVIALCEEFPENNERIKGSAHFSLGSLLLEMGKRDEARKNLESALKI